MWGGGQARSGGQARGGAEARNPTGQHMHILSHNESLIQFREVIRDGILPEGAIQYEEYVCAWLGPIPQATQEAEQGFLKAKESGPGSSQAEELGPGF